MNKSQIILDRQTLESRLKEIANSPYTASYTTCFAMCYMPGSFETTYANYKCSVCGKETRHNSDCLYELDYAKKSVGEITNRNLKVDAFIDEREYCSFCLGKEINYPNPVLKIRFSPEEEYHEEATSSYNDYKCLVAFIKDIKEYEGGSSGTSGFDTQHPLVDCIGQIVRMTGLCPEIVESWQARVNEFYVNEKSKLEEDLLKNAKKGGTLTKKYAIKLHEIDIRNIQIPYGYTKIDDEAFKDFATGSVTIPDSVISIGKSAFEGCGLYEITIPDSVTHIGKGAFSGSQLINITLPKNLTSISEEMFDYCYNLETVIIQDKVVTIEKKVFDSCSDLKAIDVDEKNPMYSSVDGILFDKEQKTLIRYPAKIEHTSYTVPDGVVTIDENAFEHCENLTCVTLPDSLTTIKKSAFLGCDKLKVLTLPNKITTIGDSVFIACENLTKLEIPKGVKHIGSLAFGSCENLTQVIIPDGVISIDSSAFYECNELQSIILPNSVTSIGRQVFEDCKKLSKIEFQGHVTYIGHDAFKNTAWLEAQPDGVIYVGNIACAYKGDKTKLTSLVLRDGTENVSSFAFDKCANLAKITFPDSITDIGSYAFSDTAWFNAQPDGIVYIKDIAYNYKGERKQTSLTLREGTKKIAAAAFTHFGKLKSITIPNSVTHIGKNAFWNCEKLKHITIPDSVIYIGEDAFGRCSKLPESILARIKMICEAGTPNG